MHLSVPRDVTRRGASCADEEEALDSRRLSQSLRMYGGIVPDAVAGEYETSLREKRRPRQMRTMRSCETSGPFLRNARGRN